jgi:hypothetical protein
MGAPSTRNDLLFESMDGPTNTPDWELVQAKWVLGGIEPGELVELAVSALEHGLDGIALSQVGGLSEPTRDDLADLTARLFAELGLKAFGRDEAIALLIARGEPATHPIISELRGSFPSFSDRWREHVKWWGGNPAGSYNDMAEFVHFVVEDLYGVGNVGETRRAFLLLEGLLSGADEEARNLIGLGFFETLQNFASWRPGGNKVYEQFLGPVSQQVWRELQIMWAGKSSLMDVIRAEQGDAESQ